MNSVQIFEPALCCSSGVRGVEVDFAGHQVARTFLERSGHESLPLILVGGQIARWARMAESPQPSTAAGCCSGSKCC